MRVLADGVDDEGLALGVTGGRYPRGYRDRNLPTRRSVVVDAAAGPPDALTRGNAVHRRRAAGDDPVRRASRYRTERVEADDAATAGAGGGRPDVPAAAAEGTGGSARPDPAGPPRAVGRMDQRACWVDVLVDQAIARGEFDHLPLAGKPLPNLTRHDPDWWLKAYVEREHVSGVLPEALQLRADAERLHDRLDEMRSEARVRDALAELNRRIVEARRQLLGGPPVVTPLRDVEAEVAAWRERRRR